MDGMQFGRYGRKDAGGDAPPDKEIENLSRQLKGVLDEVKQHGEQVFAEVKTTGKASEEAKAKADQALSQMGEITARLTEAEQKLARRGKDGAGEPELKSMGQHVIEAEQFKSGGITSSWRGSMRVGMSQKDILSVPATWGGTASVSNALVSADRQGIIVPPMRQMTIRDLLLQGQTNSNAIEYAVELVFTNNANVVAEGATKPKSDITFDLRSAPVRTIAHIFKASRQILDDAPQLRTYIDGRARYGLRLREEQQLLTGSGAGQNILGIMPQATAFAVPTGLTGATSAVDRVRAAMLQSVLSDFPPSGVVLNPIDWAGMEISKDGQGRYLFGDPQGVAQPRLWGLPVVATQAMAQGTFLVGAFNIAAQIFDRLEIEILLSTENADDFERNMVTIRAEERLALAVYRPAAFIAGPLAAA